jgi:hypothetical protein
MSKQSRYPRAGRRRITVHRDPSPNSGAVGPARLGSGTRREPGGRHQVRGYSSRSPTSSPTVRQGTRSGRPGPAAAAAHA